MVELREDSARRGTSLSKRSASYLVAVEMNADNPDSYSEGLRRRHRELDARGELPESPAYKERIDSEIAEAVGKHFQVRFARSDEARQESAAIQAKLRDLGFDPDIYQLEPKHHELIKEQDKLALSLEQHPETIVAMLVQEIADSGRVDRDLDTQEEVEKLLADRRERLRILREIVSYLDRLLLLRRRIID